MDAASLVHRGGAELLHRLPTQVAVHPAACARPQGRIGARFSVEVQPDGAHQAGAAVAKNDLARLSGVDRPQAPRDLAQRLLLLVLLLPRPLRHLDTILQMATRTTYNPRPRPTLTTAAIAGGEAVGEMEQLRRRCPRSHCVGETIRDPRSLEAASLRLCGLVC